MMQNWPTDVSINKVAQRKIALVNLKRCPLCGALNSEKNAECFVCTWHGSFLKDPTSIEEGLRTLIRNCPDLRGPVIHSKPTKRSWLSLLKSVMRKPLDYTV